MRRRFDEQLLELNQEMIAMGSRIEQAIENAGELMASRDVAAARIIMQGDQEIDRMEREIEGRCLRLLLMQQPVASDLRLISSALKMITDMERIGDQSSDIAEIITMPWKGIFCLFLHSFSKCPGKQPTWCAGPWTPMSPGTLSWPGP